MEVGVIKKCNNFCPIVSHCLHTTWTKEENKNLSQDGFEKKVAHRSAFNVEICQGKLETAKSKHLLSTGYFSME